MNQYEFLESLQNFSREYSWKYTQNRLVGVGCRGKNRGRVFNPVTAVANSFGLGYFPNTKRGILSAAKALGITQELANSVYSQSNRGHAQIVRGKMLTVVS
jgi:hypothetical protein